MKVNCQEWKQHAGRLVQGFLATPFAILLPLGLHCAAMPRNSNHA
jgi:hypothetical protein